MSWRCLCYVLAIEMHRECILKTSLMHGKWRCFPDVFAMSWRCLADVLAMDYWYTCEGIDLGEGLNALHGVPKTFIGSIEIFWYALPTCFYEKTSWKHRRCSPDVGTTSRRWFREPFVTFSRCIHKSQWAHYKWTSSAPFFWVKHPKKAKHHLNLQNNP